MQRPKDRAVISPDTCVLASLADLLADLLADWAVCRPGVGLLARPDGGLSNCCRNMKSSTLTNEPVSSSGKFFFLIP